MTNKQITKPFVLLVALVVLAGIAGCGEPQLPDQATGNFGTVGGGVDNEAGEYATVGGGSHNTASAMHATVGGGWRNTAGVEASVVGGGEGNTADGTFTTVSGGYSNVASRIYATVGGGGRNTASGKFATIGGGQFNTASGWDSTIAGGHDNVASGIHATICGGPGNTADGFGGTISGGAGNTASASHATVGGGLANRTTGIYGTVGGGYGNTASGSYSTVPGGILNEAAGDYSFASGSHARVDAMHSGAFLYADSNDLDFYSAAADEFAVRATGGVRLVTAIDDGGNPVGGVELPPGSGSWSSLSDREMKVNVSPVDEDQILLLLAGLPISTWSYVGQDPSVQHIGPMSQDFHASFGVGEDGEHISVVDADGVALAAIQGLYQLMLEQEARIAALEARIEALEQANEMDNCACPGQLD